MRNPFKASIKSKSIKLDSHVISYYENGEIIWGVKLSKISSFVFQSGPFTQPDTYFLKTNDNCYSCSAEADNAGKIWQYYLSLDDADKEAAKLAIRETGNHSFVIWENKK